MMKIFGEIARAFLGAEEERVIPFELKVRGASRAVMYDDLMALKESAANRMIRLKASDAIYKKGDILAQCIRYEGMHRFVDAFVVSTQRYSAHHHASVESQRYILNPRSQKLELVEPLDHYPEMMANDKKSDEMVEESVL